MKSSVTNGATLKRRVLQNGHMTVQDAFILPDTPVAKSDFSSKTSVMRVLFDKSHGEQLFVESSEDEAQSQENSDPILRTLLHKTFQAEKELHAYSSDSSEEVRQALTQENSPDILVLGAPKTAFADADIAVIQDFVFSGGSLLFTGSYDSLQSQIELDNGDSLNNLLKGFGLKARQLLGYPPEESSELSLHYISSEVNCVILDEPFYLDVQSIFPETINRVPFTIAAIPHTEEPFIVSVEAQRGRVVAVSDTAVFGRYLKYGDNQQLVSNIFRWLARRNPLDVSSPEIEHIVQRGTSTTFSCELENPHPKRLEYVSCLLDGGTSSEILEPIERNIRSIAPYGKVHLRWDFVPQVLGKHNLSLIVDVLSQPDYPILFFDSAFRFQCTSDIEIEVSIVNSDLEIPEITEVGKPIEVKAVTRNKANDERVDLEINLTATNFIAERIGSEGERNHWKLTAHDVGRWPVTFEATETGQRISRLIHVMPSVEAQKEYLEEQVIPKLDKEIYFAAVKVGHGLESELIQSISVRLFSPEEYVQQLKKDDSAQELLEVIRVSRLEKNPNEPLLNLLLSGITPSFSVKDGCCIPYDPKLAKSLAEKNPGYRYHLAQTFLSLDMESQSQQRKILAALIVHEKYGHGFFFTQTTLGRQLAILYKHGMTRNTRIQDIKSPYIRALFKEYEDAIRTLWDSTLILNEGFATWLEMKILPTLAGLSEKDALERKRYLLDQYDASYHQLVTDSEYFRRVPPASGTRYQEGYEYLEKIEQAYRKEGDGFSAVEALIESADVDLGITESEGKIRFNLSANSLKDALIYGDACADQRLRKIYRLIDS